MSYQKYDEVDEEEYSPLSKEQAQALFPNNQLAPRVSSPWQIIKFQCLLTIAFTIASAIYCLFFNTYVPVFSVLLGGLLGVIPSAVFIIRVKINKYGLDSRKFISSLVYAEVIKITLTVTIILLLVRLYPNLNWLCFLGMYLITLQSYWLIGFVKIKN
jgi:ATP synthase protein I